MELKNKIAVVTGASDGIGKQIAITLAKQGTNLALIGRNKKRLKDVEKIIKDINSNLKVESFSCDLKDGKQIQKTIKQIIKDFKKINILINVAGIWQKINRVDKISEKTISDVIEINLTGLIKLTNLLVPKLLKQKESAIINIASKSGVTAQAGQSVYSASKWGVRGFTEVLKADLKDNNIRIAGVYQSGTDTKMFKKVGEIVPNDKFTNPTDLANVICYMLSLPEKIWIHDIFIEY